MKMISHIFVNSSVANMFIELVLITSVPNQHRALWDGGIGGHRLVPTKESKGFHFYHHRGSTDACWIWSEVVHQQQQHWEDCESWDTSHSQGRERLYKLPLELGKTRGGDLPHIMCACYQQIPPIEETSILLSHSLHFQQTPIVRTRSTEATLLALKLQDQVQSLLKQCSQSGVAPLCPAL